MNTPHMNAALKDAPHMNALHQRSIVIDGLIIAKWDRSIFEDMRRGGPARPAARSRSGKGSRTRSPTSPT